MYLTLDPDRNYFSVDIESDDIKATVVWVVCVQDIKTKQEWTFTSYEDIREFFEEEVRKKSFFVAHNGLRFDFPTLNRVVGTRLSTVLLLDTFLYSSLYSPSLAGGHSLSAWGLRLKEEKGEFNDFSRLTDEMITYCRQDVNILTKLFLKLTERMSAVGFTEKSVQLEHEAWVVIEKQRKNGFRLDVEKAHELFSELRRIERDLQERIYHQFPPKLQAIKRFANSFKKDGSRTANYLRHCSEFPSVRDCEDGGYETFDYVSFNLGSPKQRVEKLVELGWVPLELTPTGNPKPTSKGELSPSLEAFAEESGIEEIRLIAQWITVNSRANMIGNWLDLATDGYIRGNLWLANTLRYRHDKPNTANIPAVRTKELPDKTKVPLLGLLGAFTYESRNLWIPRKSDRSLVGFDAKGVQLRILAEYLKNKEYADQVVGGDPHEYTRSITQEGTRAQNKNFLYAYLLGGGSAKLGWLLGVNAREGGRIKGRFTNNFPGLKGLLGRIEGEVERTGRIVLCDGSRSLPAEPRLALAFLLQGDESRIMRQVQVYIDRELRRHKIDAIQCGFIHDELQFDTKDEDIERLTEAVLPCFRRAGEEFGYTVPIDGSVSIGKSWALSH